MIIFGFRESHEFIKVIKSSVYYRNSISFIIPLKLISFQEGEYLFECSRYFD